MTTDATIRPHHYERWSGTLNTGRWTWLTIVATGLRLIWRDPRRQALL